MGISAACTNCGKRYQAPDRFAGKRVRCRGCGTVVQLPAAVAASEPNLGFADDTEQTAPPLDASWGDDTDVAGTKVAPAVTDQPADQAGPAAPSPAPPPRAGAPEAGVHKNKSAALWTKPAVTDAASPRASAGAAGAYGVAGDEEADAPRKRSDWFWHPQVRMVDRWLPRAIVVLGLLWMSESIRGSLAEGDGPWWIWLTRWGVVVALYTVVVVPITMIGVRAACSVQRRPVPRNLYFRTYASFLFAVVLGIAIWNAGGGLSLAVVLGTIFGLAVSSATQLLFFRLEPDETTVAAGYSSAAFLGGGLLAGVIAFLGNAGLVAALERSSVAAQGFPTQSPIWNGAKWVDASKLVAPAPPPKRPAVAATPATPTPISPTAPTSPTAPPDVAQVPRVTSPAVVPEVPRPNRTDTPPREPNIFDTPRVTDDPRGTAPPPNPPPNPTPNPTPAAPDSGSALVTSRLEVKTPAGVVAVLRPLAGVGGAAVMLRIESKGRVTADWYDAGWRSKRLSAAFDEPVPPPTAALATSYAVNSDGSRLVRLRGGGSPAILVYAAGSSAATITLPLDADARRPALIGFVDNDRLLFQKDAGLVMCVNLADDRPVAQTMNLTDAPADARFAVDADGVRVAAAWHEGSGAGGRQVIQTSAVRSRMLLQRWTVPLAEWTEPPTGLAFSPDGRSLAAVYERGGTTKVVVYPVSPEMRRTDSTGVQPALDRQYPESFGSPVTPPTNPASSLAWFPDGRSLLIHGAAALDAATGVKLGTLKIPRVTAFRFAGPDEIDLTLRGEDNSTEVVRLALDPAELDRNRPKPK